MVASRWHGLLVNLSLLLIAVIFCFAVLEISIRLFWEKGDVFYVEDTTVGYISIPNKSGHYVSNEFNIPITINSLGFRDRDFDINKADDIYRIAVLGDSFIEAMMIDYNQTFYRILEQKLNSISSDKEVEVLNFGLSGTGTGQQYLIYDKYVKQYKPDLVILGFFVGNDVRNNYYSFEGDPYRPYFDMKDDKIIVPEKVNFSIRYLVVKFVRRNLRFVDFILTKIDRVRKKRNTGGVPLDYLVFKSSYNPNWDIAWNITKDIILKMNGDIKDNNAQFIMVIIPLREQVHPDTLQKLLNIYPALKLNELDMDKPDKILLEFCMTHDIKCIDLLPSFRKASEDKARLYFEIDGHWNPSANKIAADILVGPITELISGK